MASRVRFSMFLLVPVLTFMLSPLVGSALGQEPAESPPAPAEATVQLVGLRAVPEHLDITTGTTVTWVNNEPLDYPVVSGKHQLVADDGSWASPVMAPGTRWSRRFDDPGTVRYHSATHDTAAGEIAVTGDPIVNRPVEREVAITEPNPDDPTTWGFEPPDLIIETGTTVIWRNNGKNVHTVSADDKSFDSGEIQPGATWQHTFESAGAFAYHCTPHPWMQAQVRIVAPGGTTPPPAVTDGHSGAGHGTVVPATPGPTARRVGRGPVRHDVTIFEPDPSKPAAWTFAPATLDAKVGDTVVWHNAGGVDHSVTSASFDSGLIRPGATWEHTFSTTGVFDYHCTPHPWMKGVLRVSELDDEALLPLRVAATSGRSDPAAAPRRAAEPARIGNDPVTHEALILEPDLQQAMAWRFDPPAIEARVGDTVTWRNTGTLQHTVTADGGAFDSGMLDAAGTFGHRFDAPGRYEYHCTPHPWMKGTVRVIDASGAEPPTFAPLTSGEQASGPLTQAGGVSRPLNLAGQGQPKPGPILPLSLALAFLIVGTIWHLAGGPALRRQ